MDNDAETPNDFERAIFDNWTILFTGGAIAALIALAGLFGVQWPYWAASLVVAATVIFAVYRAGKAEHKKRLALIELLKPKLKILNETEVSPDSPFRAQVIVQNTCKQGLRFGAEVTKISPDPVIPLPFALRLIPESDSLTEFIPAEATRRVDVIRYDRYDNNLEIIGRGSSFVSVAREPYTLTIRVYSDIPGTSPLEDFQVVLEDKSLKLRSVMATQAASGNTIANTRPNKWSPGAKAWRHLNHLAASIFHRRTNRKS